MKELFGVLLTIGVCVAVIFVIYFVTNHEYYRQMKIGVVDDCVCLMASTNRPQCRCKVGEYIATIEGLVVRGDRAYLSCHAYFRPWDKPDSYYSADERFPTIDVGPCLR